MNKNKQWTDIGRLLGYGGIPGLSTQLRNSYIRVILPYEHYSEGVKNSTALNSGKQREAQTPPRNSNEPDPTSLGSPLSVTSSPLSEPPDDGELPGMTNGATRSRMNGVRHSMFVTLRSQCVTQYINSEMNGKPENGIKRPHSPANLHGDGKEDKQEVSCYHFFYS